MKLMTTYENNNYPIIVTQHAMNNHLQPLIEGYQDVFLFVDAQVNTHWSHKLNSIQQQKITQTFILPAGEQVKTLTYYEKYLNALLALKPTRNTCLIAIGGGAVGDFVGFLAATLLRGVDFIQVPTTILAHDSSIGGKVGINAQYGKNLIGAFHRPSAVIYDLDFLSTLPTQEILSGYGEVYKHALLEDDTAVETLEQTYPDLAALLTLHNIEHYISKGIQVKLNIVVKDEKERGQRQWLNLGHTLGHAVEYHSKIAHGHAVMIGILFQMIVANQLLNTHHDIRHYYNYLLAVGYPLDVIDTLTFKPLLQLMQQDKKNDQSGIRMVLLEKLGHPVVKTVSPMLLEQAFEVLQSLRRS
ncbi:3-dehydroquinate synthase [Staphylococcus sp. 17KM0847]|uniref:3-dehydroquinate synthase n=1 Tax=Staphylococcus sp. 17KM0847 TaxID=2583989 RepID=UPI0015DBD32B|nr:3-dehydroquinate synthase [Staphylococcus sp. 17KM0847]QLK86140.1 3-dehydroquinate synthase [Staphylococcus sp. 17KM0847]